MKIPKCNTAYYHNGVGIGVGHAGTRNAARQIARRQAQAMANALPGVWIRAELTDCPKACPGEPQYLVRRRGNTQIIAEANLFNGLHMAVAITPWQIVYWCGKLPRELKALGKKKKK